MSDNLPQKLDILYGLRLHARDYGAMGSLDVRSGYRTLLGRLGNPHLHIPPAIHVAGTNGKGSTIAFLKAMYEAGGYKVHVYTSPHLVRFHERIVIAGQEIDDQTLENLIDEVMSHAEGLTVTFFEVVTAMAFLAFTRTPADLTLLETGMGGRIDCTNVIPHPLVTIVTRVSLDHRQYLGHTIHDIANEKAGIMKPGAPCVISYQHEASNYLQSHDPETLPFDSVARQLNVPLHRAGQEWSVSKSESDPSHFMFRYGSLQKPYKVPNLVGEHQLENAGAALACTYVVNHLTDSLTIHGDSRQAGLTGAYWPGRLQRLTSGPLVDNLPKDWELWLDGGHNDSAGQVLARQATQWHTQDTRPLHLIIGMKRDKEAGLFLAPLLPHVTSLTFIPVPGFEDQSHPPEVLAQEILTHHPDTRVTTSLTLNQAVGDLNCKQPATMARVLITGSLYLSGHVLQNNN